MKAKIVSIDRSSETPIVGFECSAGHGLAVWSSKLVPSPEDDIGVEFNIDLVVKVGMNASVIIHQRFAIAVEGSDEVRINGYVEGQDDDGVLYLRVSADCLIMIASDTVGLAGEWLSIRASVRQFRVTPVGW